jgi:lia operon protein LiaG
MSSPHTSGAVLLAGMLLLPGGLAAQTVERYELVGDHVAVFNLAGSATIEAGTGSAVVVEVRRQGGDAGRIEIQQGPIGDGQTLRVVYPDADIQFRQDGWSGRTQMRVNPDGTFGGWSGRRDGSRRVTITSDGGGMEAHADLRILVPRGQRLNVYLGVGPISATNVTADLRLDGTSSKITTTGTTGTLVVDVGSGAVQVTRHTGDGSIDTGSGSVEVAEARGDDLSIDTGSGGVRLSGVTVRRLNIDTGSGDVDGSGIEADALTIDTGSGEVEFSLTRAARDIEVDTGSGDVTIAVPDGLDAEVALETSSGSIEVDFAMQIQRWERDEVRGVIGNGAGRLHIDTGSGDITIRKR